jgi:hypothetical protein
MAPSKTAARPVQGGGSHDVKVGLLVVQHRVSSVVTCQHQTKRHAQTCTTMAWHCRRGVQQLGTCRALNLWADKWASDVLCTRNRTAGRLGATSEGAVSLHLRGRVLLRECTDLREAWQHLLLSDAGWLKPWLKAWLYLMKTCEVFDLSVKSCISVHWQGCVKVSTLQALFSSSWPWRLAHPTAAVRCQVQP